MNTKKKTYTILFDLCNLSEKVGYKDPAIFGSYSIESEKPMSIEEIRDYVINHKNVYFNSATDIKQCNDFRGMHVPHIVYATNSYEFRIFILNIRTL